MSSIRRAGAMPVILLAVALQGCGGGDDEADDAYAAGLYQGSMVLNGTNRSFVVAVAPDGMFVGGIGASAMGAADLRVVVGNGESEANGFSATGTAFASQAAPFAAGGVIAPLSITNGLIDESVRLQGDYAAGGESGNFTVQYRTEMTQRGALLSRIAGTYDSFPGPATPEQNLVMTIDSSGAFTLVGAGCPNAGTGQITIQDPDVNVYSVVLNTNDCLPHPVYSGLISLEDALAGFDNRLIMLVTTPAQNASFGYGGLKR